MAPLTKALEADGEAVWSWRPDAGVKLAGSILPMTVARKPGHRGERGISRNPPRRECRIASAEPVCSCAFFCALLHTRPRVQRAPGIPCALSSERAERLPQNSRAMRGEIAKLRR
jgi:hypothetical protein